MNSRERFTSENLVRHHPDRPPVRTHEVVGGLNVGKRDQLVVKVREPLTAPRVVRGHTIGGGTSTEAIRRTRKHLMNGRFP